MNRSERAIETVELARRIRDEENQLKLMATIIANDETVATDGSITVDSV